jgi:hypothetical protein
MLQIPIVMPHAIQHPIDDGLIAQRVTAINDSTNSWHKTINSTSVSGI